jgi:mannosylglycerate hydrolase
MRDNDMRENNKAKTGRMGVSVVVQTHWDREWYFPHQQYLARLVVVMERVVAELESGKLKSFLFDGQTAAYEDLVANAEPVLVKKVQRLVREKRIVLGPWYVMADEFLVSGESLLRNLELGIADANAAGNCQRVGYLPDTFGHVSQMPQMLRMFGIDSAVMWRGVDAKHSEFDWVAPDGSVVGSVFLTEGYYQHPFNVADWQLALTAYLTRVTPRTLASRALLTQGGDHLAPGADFAARVSEFNRTQDAYTLEQSSLAQYTEHALKDSAGRRERIAGRLRDNAQAFVLPDVMSTRRYLKLANQSAEDRLTGVVEPLFAALDIDDVPQTYLEQCWRLLLQNQAHDSICGCSVDAVHREMLTRYAQLEQRCDALIERACAAAGMVAVAQHDANAPDVFADDSVFTLFNPQPKRFHGWSTQRVFVKGALRDHLAVASSTGERLPAQVLSATATSMFRSPIDDFPERIAGFSYEIAVHCSLPGLGALDCTLAWDAPARPIATAAQAAIENAHLRVALEADGTITITEKASGQRTSEFFGIISELDAGDTYNFSPPPQQHTVRQPQFSLLATQFGEHVQTLNVSVDLNLPAGLREDRQGPTQATVTNRGELRLRLFADARAVECQLEWANHARDQRTRLTIPVANNIESVFADSAFSWERYPRMRAAYPAAPSRREMPIAVMPTLSAVVAGRVGVAHRAMQECEIVSVGGNDYLAMTLVRSVGWMSRRDLVTRGVGAGPDIETPEAQCLGTERFDFAIGFVDDHVAWLNLAQSFRKPPVLLRGHTARWRKVKELGEALQVSATRCVGDQLEMRVWNPTAVNQSLASLTLHGPQWHLVTADTVTPIDENTALAPHRIATLRCAR